MATYRATIKGWDRHYGSGHVLWSYKHEGRASKKAEQRAVEQLEKAMQVHTPQPTDMSAEAWAEVSDRSGPRLLVRYLNADGSWLPPEAMRANGEELDAVSQEDIDEGLEMFEALAYRVQDAGEEGLGEALLGISDAVEAVLAGSEPEGIDGTRRVAYERTIQLLEDLT